MSAKLIRSVEITDTVLDSSNIYETVPTAYNGGTTYADGDIVSVSGSGNSHTVYESLQGSNTGNTPASSPLFWQARGTVYGAYNAGTTYAAGDRVTDTTNHLIYESAVNSNTGQALTDTTKWIEVGPSNKWAPFDGKTGTIAEWNAEISYTFDITGRIDTLQLLNMRGSTVNVTMHDGADEIWNEDYRLRTSEGLNSWTSWLFERRKFRTDLAIEGLPKRYSPTLEVTLTGANTVSVGTINPGYSRSLGSTQYNATAGITDYSKIEADDFGVRSITQRGYVKNMGLEIWVDTENTDIVFNLLTEYRATPVGVIGSPDFGSLNQFGLLKDWRVRIAYPSHSIIDLDFEAL